jgi:hypothetical protein
MQIKKRAWEKGSFCGVLLGALAIASTVAKADTFGVQLAGGVADHGVKKVDLGGVPLYGRRRSARSVLGHPGKPGSPSVHPGVRCDAGPAFYQKFWMVPAVRGRGRRCPIALACARNGDADLFFILPVCRYGGRGRGFW